MKHHRISPPAIGGSSLLVSFALLALTVFALLSLSTVQAEKRMADAAEQSVTDYYAADLEAERIFARLRSGETVSGISVNGNIYSYYCAISENQILDIELEKKENTWTVLRWQVIASPEAISETLPVWDGA